MNFSLIREWLKLSPGLWPPTDRELLGLSEKDSADAANIELKALERMDILRPHQLRHAELVTEGMNRLAQAMISLTAGTPIAISVPKKPKKVVREQTPLEIRKPTYDVNLDVTGPLSKPPKPATQSQIVLEAEVVGSAVDSVDMIPESYAVQSDEPTVPPLDEPITIPEPPPGLVVPPSPRRNGYREIVRIRRFHDSWTKFRPLLGDPGERLLTPSKIVAYLEAITEFRAALHVNQDRLITFPDLAGDSVVSVVCHPVPISLLRDLVLSQRRVLARDWAIAEADLSAKAKRMRVLMTRSRRTRPMRRVREQVSNMFRKNPELILLLIITLAIAIGFIRG